VRGLTSFGGSYLSGKAEGDMDAATDEEQAAVDAEVARINARSLILDDSAPVVAVPRMNESGEFVTPKLPETESKYNLSPRDQIAALTQLAGRSDIGKEAAGLYMPIALSDLERADAKALADRPEFKALGAGERPGTVDPRTGAFTPAAGSPEPPPYSGTSIEAQTMNILLNGDPSSEIYLSAWNNFSNPKITLDPGTGQIVTQTPNMSAFRRPTAGGQNAGNGGLTFGPIPGAPPPTTEGERTAGFLYNRMESSLKQLQAAIAANPDSEAPTAVSSIASFINPTLENVVAPERQSVVAAQLDILDSALTLGTGAAYTKQQLEGYRRSLFPQFNDTQETLKDKAQRLENVLNAARIKAGRAAGRAVAPPPAPAGTPSPTAAGAQTNSDEAPPLKYLTEGVITKFKNGESWTKQGGKAVKVN